MNILKPKFGKTTKSINLYSNLNKEVPKQTADRKISPEGSHYQLQLDDIVESENKYESDYGYK